jgi:hypothetical protein
MSDLETLLDRLKDAQRTPVLQAAQLLMLPPDGTLRKIADLENTIAAVEALMNEAGPTAGPQR